MNEETYGMSVICHFRIHRSPSAPHQTAPFMTPLPHDIIFATWGMVSRRNKRCRYGVIMQRLVACVEYNHILQITQLAANRTRSFGASSPQRTSLDSTDTTWRSDTMIHKLKENGITVKQAIFTTTTTCYLEYIFFPGEIQSKPRYS